jgi:hypothetical protein
VVQIPDVADDNGGFFRLPLLLPRVLMKSPAAGARFKLVLQYQLKRLSG